MAATSKFEVYETANGGYAFRLKSANGEIIAQSEGYATKDDALKGIEAVKRSAVDAHIEQGLSMRHR